MKKQRKTTAPLSFYYPTPSLSSGSDSAFCPSESRPLTAPGPQPLVSNVVKEENTTNHSIPTSTVFLCQLVLASSLSSAFISIQFSNDLKKFKKTVFFIIFIVQKFVDIWKTQLSITIIFISMASLFIVFLIIRKKKLVIMKTNNKAFSFQQQKISDKRVIKSIAKTATIIRIIRIRSTKWSKISKIIENSENSNVNNAMINAFFSAHMLTKKINKFSVNQSISFSQNVIIFSDLIFKAIDESGANVSSLSVESKPDTNVTLESETTSGSTSFNIDINISISSEKNSSDFQHFFFLFPFQHFHQQKGFPIMWINDLKNKHNVFFFNDFQKIKMKSFIISE